MGTNERNTGDGVSGHKRSEKLWNNGWLVAMSSRHCVQMQGSHQEKIGFDCGWQGRGERGQMLLQKHIAFWIWGTTQQVKHVAFGAMFASSNALMVLLKMQQNAQWKSKMSIYPVFTEKVYERWTKWWTAVSENTSLLGWRRWFCSQPLGDWKSRTDKDCFWLEVAHISH